MTRQGTAGALRVEMPGWTATEPLDGRELAEQRSVLAHQYLGRPQPADLRPETFTAGHLRQTEAPASEVEDRDPDRFTTLVHGHEQALPALFEQRLLGDRTRGHDAGDLAFHRALGDPGVAHLLADHDRLAKLHEPGEIPLDGVRRDPGHGDGLARRGAARGKRDVEEARGLPGVLEEKLVEIAHSVEEQQLRVLGLEPEILFHHRRVLGLAHERECIR